MYETIFENFPRENTLRLSVGDVVEEGERGLTVGVDEEGSNSGLVWVGGCVVAERRDVRKV